MKNKRVKGLKLLASVLVVIVMLLGGIGLNLLVERSNSTKEASHSQETNRLDIAVVNEDKAVLSQDGKDSYALGDDYIKTLERDSSENWTITTRSSAEYGLKSGRYQLIIFIPSDLSSKVLDINNVLVDKTTVTYKIKA